MESVRFVQYAVFGIALAAALVGLGQALWACRGARSYRPWVLLVLRTALYGTLLAAVLNPALSRAVTHPVRPVVAVLYDVSASMNLPAGDGDETRMAAVWRQAAPEHISRSLPDTAIRVLYFAEKLQTLPPAAEPDGRATDLAGAIAQARAVTPLPRALIVITDGAFTGPHPLPAARAAAAAGTRVYTVGVGSSQPPPDVALTELSAPRIVNENTPFTIHGTVRSTGISGRVPLTLSRDDTPADTLSLELESGRTTRWNRQLPGLPVGRYLLTARVEPHESEADVANNERTVMVEVRRETTRVVVIAGSPGLEYAALRRLLEVLPRTETTFHARLAEGMWLSGGAGGAGHRAPQLSRDLANAHVLVLADIEAAAVDVAAVTRFVSEGGSLAVLGGARSLGAGGYGAAHWAPLLPVELSAGAGYLPAAVSIARPRPHHPLGDEWTRLTSPAWWDTAPPLAGHNPTGPLRTGAALAVETRDGAPLVATRTYGAGRTLTVASGGTHRWLLSPQASDDSRRLHEAFWTALFAWLSEPPDDRPVLLALDPPVARRDMPVRALVWVRRGTEPLTGAQVTVTVGEGDAAAVLAAMPSPAEPGRYEVALSGLAPGRLRIAAEAVLAEHLGRAERVLLIEPHDAETAVPTLQQALLEEVARAGQGEYVHLDDISRLLRNIQMPVSVEESVRQWRPLRTWPVFLIITALCGADWLLRRRWGL